MADGKNKKNALETAAGILGMRPCSKLELRRKLYKKERFLPAEIERAVADLERMGFLSDRRFCEDAVRILRERGYGPIRIRTRMLGKGIPRDILDDVMSAVPDDPAESLTDTDRALALIRRNETRFRREQDPMKRKEKVLRFLAGRGFSAETAYQTLDQWSQGESEQ